MDEIAIVKKQVQQAEWAERIRKCSESGLTVSEWCRENGIKLKTYYFYLRKLRKEQQLALLKKALNGQKSEKTQAIM
nr:MAG TPA: putative terminase small subunit [Inoviridae sp.]